MYKGRTVAVVVPAYNEEGFVGDVIDTVPDFVDRVYAIDDRSTDGTWEEIERHARLGNEAPAATVSMTDGGAVEATRVVPIRHEENRGVGGAIKTGYKRAAADGMDVVAVMNGDGQMDPAILDRIVDPVVAGRADYSKGNRLVRREYRDGMSTWRFFGNSVLTLLTKIASGYWRLMDPQNGYTAISAEALAAIDLDSLYEDYGFCNDLLVTLNVHDMRVVDVPMRAVYGEETSSIRYSRFIPKLSFLLLADFLWRLKAKYLLSDFHPLVFLYGIGAAGGILGTVHALVSTARGRRGADGLASAATLLLLGCVATVLGMVLDMEHNAHLDRRADTPDARTRVGEHSICETPEDRR